MQPRFKSHPEAFSFAVHYLATIFCERYHSFPLFGTAGTVLFPCGACGKQASAALTRALRVPLANAVKAASKKPSTTRRKKKAK